VVRPEVIVTLQPSAKGTTEAEWALPVELPTEMLARLVNDPATLVTPVIASADGLVLHGAADLASVVPRVARSRVSPSRWRYRQAQCRLEFTARGPWSTSPVC
jgi:hypothetical protein